jgi:hypothetical protein
VVIHKGLSVLREIGVSHAVDALDVGAIVHWKPRGRQVGAKLGQGGSKYVMGARGGQGMAVYFIQVGEDGPIKIGISDGVADRLAALQTTLPYELRVVAVIPRGDRAMEQDLHLRFRSHWIRGEWFVPHPELLLYIQIHGKPFKPPIIRRAQPHVKRTGVPSPRPPVVKATPIPRPVVYNAAPPVVSDSPIPSTMNGPPVCKDRMEWFRGIAEAAKRLHDENHALLPSRRR